MSHSQSSPKNQPRADLSAPDLQDGRYGRFGLWAGLGVALAVHLIFFALPKPGTFEESASESERGIVVRTYRQRAFIPGQGAATQQAEPSTPLAPGRPRPTPKVGENAGGSPVEVEMSSSTAPETKSPNGEPQAGGSWGATVGGTELSAGSEAGTDGGQQLEAQAGKAGQSASPSPAMTANLSRTERGSSTPQVDEKAKEWERMLATLQKTGESQAASRSSSSGSQTEDVRPKAQKVKAVEEPAPELEQPVDKRIRMSVVSYPPTSVEKKFPQVPYPDIGVARRRLEAGICRVYYRVWVNGAGDIVRDEVKSPSTPEDRKKYEPFIQAVKDSVADWQFDQMEAQVHVDVLFEIK